VIADIVGIPVDVHQDLLRIGNDAALTLDPALSWREYPRRPTGAIERATPCSTGIAEVRRNPGTTCSASWFGQRGRRPAQRRRAAGQHPLADRRRVRDHGQPDRQRPSRCCRSPGSARRAAGQPGRMGNAVEEVLRYDSPVQLTLRIRRRHVQISVRGFAPAPGVSMLARANRDPSVFETQTPSRRTSLGAPAPRIFRRHPLLPRQPTGPTGSQDRPAGHCSPGSPPWP